MNQSVEKLLQDLLRGFVLDPDQYVRNLGYGALARLCSVSGSGFTNQEIKFLWIRVTLALGRISAETSWSIVHMPKTTTGHGGSAPIDGGRDCKLTEQSLSSSHSADRWPSDSLYSSRSCASFPRPSRRFVGCSSRSAAAEQPISLSSLPPRTSTRAE